MPLRLLRDCDRSALLMSYKGSKQCIAPSTCELLRNFFASHGESGLAQRGCLTICAFPLVLCQILWSVKRFGQSYSFWGSYKRSYKKVCNCKGSGQFVFFFLAGNAFAQAMSM